MSVSIALHRHRRDPHAISSYTFAPSCIHECIEGHILMGVSPDQCIWSSRFVPSMILSFFRISQERPYPRHLICVLKKGTPFLYAVLVWEVEIFDGIICHQNFRTVHHTSVCTHMWLGRNRSWHHWWEKLSVDSLGSIQSLSSSMYMSGAFCSSWEYHRFCCNA